MKQKHDGKTSARANFRIWLERRFSCVYEKFLWVTYVQNYTHVSEETELFQKPNVTQCSSGEGAIGKL